MENFKPRLSCSIYIRYDYIDKVTIWMYFYFWSAMFHDLSSINVKMCYVDCHVRVGFCECYDAPGQFTYLFNRHFSNFHDEYLILLIYMKLKSIFMLIMTILSGLFNIIKVKQSLIDCIRIVISTDDIIRH